MRILIAHSFYRIPGGEDRYVRAQADLLARQHEVELFSSDNRALTSSLRTAQRMGLSSECTRDVATILGRFRPDVIHLHNVYPAIGPAVHLAARRAGVPLVMTVHNFRLRCPNGLMFTENDLCRRCENGAYFNAVVHHCFPDRRQAASYAAALWLHRYVLRLERLVDLFVAPSDFVRERLLSWGIADDKVRVIRHFVEPSHQPNDLAGRFGLYIGRLASEKGVEVLLRALALAGDPPFRVVGDGPQRARLEDLRSDLGLGNTSFTGQLSPIETAEAVAESRFLVLPSLVEETASLAALEAMAASRPLIVSEIGALPELLTGGGGLGFRRGEPRDLAARISRLLNDDALCVRLGRLGLEDSRSRFDPALHLAGLETAYEHALRVRVSLD